MGVSAELISGVRNIEANFADTYRRGGWVGRQPNSDHYGKYKKILPLPGVERRLICLPDRNFVIVFTPVPKECQEL